MTYRAEIDGLRAIAVLPVIFCHAGFYLFNGGYVGVDVFFAISGYLITTLILEEMQRGHFSLPSFYERRARRILPALFIVMAASACAAWVMLPPGAMASFASSMVSVLFFSSNVLFWQQSGYFDLASELKPLLHTWSLAVEEQFYLLFPLAMLAVFRAGPRRLAFVLLGGSDAQLRAGGVGIAAPT